VAKRAAAEMRAFEERHVELWNAGDKEAWIAHMKKFSPGGFAIEDPVGTPIKQGHDILNEIWDRSFNESVWKLSIDRLITGGNEVVVVLKDEGVTNGSPVVVYEIDLIRFGDDGSVHIRSFWDVPTGSVYGEWATASS
jgi:hypothetical protein